jgi:pimeloyl-ACP methyl ester carboxylesterase
VIFFCINFFWWILLLAALFVTPPGLNTRGSGFFDFAFVTLTAGNLLVALLFFTNPSKAMRVSLGILAVVLMVDMILILAVHQVRDEEGPAGISSVVWAFFIAVWCLIADRVVASAKAEEEERLTGRVETRHSLKEWLEILIATILLVAFIVMAVLMTATLILRSRDASLQWPGTRYRVDGEKYAVHLACVGNVTSTAGKKVPTVLLESGEQPSEYQLEKWMYSAFTNGTVQRYCYWDRPGYAFSDNAPSPHSAGMSASALSEVLAISGEQGPWILVSAGYGSIVSRIFASQHFHDIAGMMLIDPLHEDLLHRIGSPSAGFMIWAYGIISPLGLFRIPGALFKGRTREDRVYGISSFQSGKMIKARLQENLVANSLTRNEVGVARTIQDRDTPLVVVSSGIESRRDREWGQKQEESTKVTDNLVKWSVVNKAPHEVWRTYDGRQTMEKGLSKLIAAAKYEY